MTRDLISRSSVEVNRFLLIFIRYIGGKNTFFTKSKQNKIK